jgi:Uma2 family endonuclease
MTSSGVALYRLTVRQFEAMIDAGVFLYDARDPLRVELLGGMLVDKLTRDNPHAYAVGCLGDHLRDSLPTDWRVREEKSITLGRFSRPEPDVVAVRGRLEDYRVRAPRAQDVALLIEVADTTYAKDCGAKWRLYAAWGMPIYWIVNLPARQVEVYTNPSGRGKAAAYRDAQTYGPDAEPPVVIDGREVGRVAVRDLLP